MTEPEINLSKLALTRWSHVSAHEHAKANGMTVTYAPWHPKPGYTFFKTGSLLSRNEDYPSGLVIVDEKGVPHPFTTDFQSEISGDSFPSKHPQ